ncbi:uncharacterized protein CcaverHIS019_0406140 [Cutaneotrichosporon cavernicola]|uniref:Peroxisomal ATPase PEX1 n=1 Tax=Cutaneotrichosporon cavernicola TaxID=279322 RepID=A0AA48L4F7_9TREE|nr:uncharacterized protein CcaverHIS019_0406140 [Cutaneotrichosporon cavernicola]BEI91794.1 hypothetical protein CcaverHIS019_0406140 [Cutaneotrichosporon cavernicola]
MARKAAVKYRSLRSNLVHLPLSLYASLAQSQTRPQSLILHLAPLVPASSSRRAPQVAYLGWSGLAAASSLSGIGGSQLETIEVDPEVALNYGWAEGTILEISIIHNPTKARSVSVTPLSTDDWEILEQNANYLENNLLGQLRAAQKGQEIDVWVMGRTKIRIRVDATNPPTTASSAVLVNFETEIYVAPRPRGQEAPKEAPKVMAPARANSGSGGSNSQKKPTKGASLRVVPPKVAAQWGPAELSADDVYTVGADKVAFVAPATLNKVRARLGEHQDGAPLLVNLRVKRVEDEEKKDEAPEAEPPKEGEEQPEEEPPLEAWLAAWDGMPAGCMVLSGELEPEWKNWGVAKLGLATQKSSRTKANGHRSVPMIEVEAEKKATLAGVDGTIDKALSYFRRGAFTGHARPLLLTGGKGSGKTVIAKAVAEALEADRSVLSEVIYDDVGRLDSDARVSSLKETMGKWIEDARRQSPCILVLDNLDLILGPESELGGASSNAAILAEHFTKLFSVSALPKGLLVLATATGSAGLHPLLTSKHIFGESMKVPPPKQETRREILEAIVQSQQEDSPRAHSDDEEALDYVTLAQLTEGYAASDLNDFVTGALQQSMIRGAKEGNVDAPLLMDDFVAAQEAFTPISLRGISLQKSDVRWSDIGGLHDARAILRETLEWPTKYARIFAKCPLRLRSGLLLYGYPGCGKTLLASAVAKETGLNFISVKGPEILNKYIGASEQSVRDLFERASAAKPCVLFFDEFDSIAPKRGHDSTGVTDRVVNQMLTEMDGAQGLDGVYVLAATSRPDLIDPALLRPGRLDKAILCDMPSLQDRLEIIQAFTKKLECSPSIDFEQLAVDTEGFSGADLQALVYNAHLDVVHSLLNKPEDEPSGKGKAVDKGKGKAVDKGKGKAVEDGGKGKETNGSAEPSKPKPYHQLQPEEAPVTSAQRSAFTERIETIVTSTNQVQGDAEEVIEKKKVETPAIEERHLRMALMNMRPSVSAQERARFGRIYHSFVADRDGNLPNGEGPRDTGTRTSLK